MRAVEISSLLVSGICAFFFPELRSLISFGLILVNFSTRSSDSERVSSSWWNDCQEI